MLCLFLFNAHTVDLYVVYFLAVFLLLYSYICILFTDVLGKQPLMCVLYWYYN